MLPLHHLLLALWLFTITAYAQASSNCQPSALGQPCASGGLAIAAGAEPSLNLGVGNPIHLITGNNYQQETDMPANPSAFGLEIIRHYNALDPEVSVLGRGWRLSYDTRLFKAGGRWQVVQADGSRISFDANGQAATIAHGQLLAKNQHYIWTWSNGLRLEFDPYGYLAGIISPDEQRLRILREPLPGVPPHAISQVINHQGHSLNFHYRSVHGHSWLQSIQAPLGQFHYRINTDNSTQDTPAAKLQAVTRPDGMQKHYLYEAQHQSGNAHALTGINVLSADGQRLQRLNTWIYDEQGRAVTSIRGAPESLVDKISVNYVRPPLNEQNGLTLVTSADKRITRFTTQIRQGRYLLSAIDGAACPGCAAPGMQADYNPNGLLTKINGIQLQRSSDGKLQTMMIKEQGWPELSMSYLANGRRSLWSSRLSGIEHMDYDSLKRPSQRRFANGDSIRYGYDAQGRPSSMQESNATGILQTTLSWHGRLLTHIRHPHETETRRYDAQQRMIQRHIERPALGVDTALRYTESFNYDEQSHLTRHQLPEGGALLYTWGQNGRLSGIQWLDQHGKTHAVISTIAGQAGYRYGNGLHLTTGLNVQKQVDGLYLTHGQENLWAQHQHYDAHGRLQQEDQQFTDPDRNHRWRYAYDQESRLIGADNATDTRWYAWNTDGSLAALKNGDNTSKPLIEREASGLALSIGSRQVVYGPNRRLIEVHSQGQQIALYRHNAFGYRIFRSGNDERTHYFYLDNKLVAQAQGGTTITRRYIYADQVLVGFIDYDVNGNTDAADRVRASLYAVHSDLIGAPVLVTDAERQLRWQAHYQPTGMAAKIAGDLTLDLRLPGQVYDELTGWHDNLLRTYLPQWGYYLEPDPLGPVPGQQALGYAAQQPRRYIDPLGLLLFAFDGTRNSPLTTSNVWKMSQYYQDGAVYYHSGPGNPMYIDWDAITANQATQIIDTQWQSLLNALQDSSTLKDSTPIDIIGFSRGAALARHFGNLINQHVNNGLFSYNDQKRGLITACVDLRFMGLFDTVAQFGLAGSQNDQYDLSIAAAWEWVAHAVALNERRVLFPLTLAADTAGNNIIEAPFIGAHADIGGGLALSTSNSSPDSGDLADVALNWMLWQARAATLRFGDVPDNDRIISNPIVHDERAPLLRSLQDSDRSVNAATGVLLHHYQDDHAKLGREQRTSAESAIVRNPDWRSQAGTAIGSVNMDGYARWLYEELGWQALPV